MVSSYWFVRKRIYVLSNSMIILAQDYTLILGMPGTGKTMTTAAIICALVRQNKSVLLTAYTHSALDNVLSKVHKSGIDVLRLGNPDRVRLSASKYKERI